MGPLISGKSGLVKYYSIWPDFRDQTLQLKDFPLRVHGWGWCYDPCTLDCCGCCCGWIDDSDDKGFLVL